MCTKRALQLCFLPALLVLTGAPPALSASPDEVRPRESGSMMLAQADTEDENFKKAMELLQPKDNHKPSLEEVDHAGEMLMEAGPDAFERAMNLLKSPKVKHSEMAEVKSEMMKGGADATERVMKLLRQSFGY
jgi:hypothetical protein